MGENATNVDLLMYRILRNNLQTTEVRNKTYKYFMRIFYRSVALNEHNELDWQRWEQNLKYLVAR